MSKGENPDMSPGDEAPAGTRGTGPAVCQTCLGKGKVQAGKVCPTCNGTGEVIQGIGGG
jgi:RecJ-like exonuclease